MPSPRSPRPNDLVALAAVLILSWGCSSGPSVRTDPGAGASADAGARISPEDRPFLVSPLEGYPLVLAPEDAIAIEEAHEALVTKGDATRARDLAAFLLRQTPGLHAATVLDAEALLVERRPGEAMDLLQPVLDELPEYEAAVLVHARSAELAGDLVAAFGGYHDLTSAGSSGIATTARERVEVLRPTAVEIMDNRISAALARLRQEDAEEALEVLEGWAPESPVTVEAAVRVAAAVGDRERELEQIRRLSSLAPDRRQLRERQAELEVAVGDPGAGVNLLRQLVAENPDVPALQASLEKAEFSWRISLLPGEVQSLVRAPQLNRASVARLLYWLVPAVRYGRPQQGRIATDILDHENREEMARVINLGLMDVDETLHRFSPERDASRYEALAAVLHLLDIQRQRPACLGTTPLVENPSYATVCRKAAECRLIEAEADCLPRGPVTGEEAVEMVRRALRLVGEA